MRMLIVDDDELILSLLGTFLAELGETDVVLESSPQEALRRIRSQDVTFDCFLFDIMMPVIDGLELCDITRSDPRYAETPIVMITARTDRDSMQAAFEAGATDYLVKPIDLLDLEIRLGVIRKLTELEDYKRFDEISDGEVIDGSLSQDLEDLVSLIRENTGFLEHHMLVKYLSSLSDNELRRTFLMRFQLLGLHGLLEQLDPPDRSEFLEVVSIALRTALPASQKIFAQIHRDTFECFFRGDPDRVSIEFANSVERNLAETVVAETENGQTIHLNLKAHILELRPITERLISEFGNAHVPETKDLVREAAGDFNGLLDR